LNSKPGLILQHGPAGPPDILGEWLDERGIVHVERHAPPQIGRRLGGDHARDRTAVLGHNNLLAGGGLVEEGEALGLEPCGGNLFHDHGHITMVSSLGF
jgi:hypothetical protein